MDQDKINAMLLEEALAELEKIASKMEKESLPLAEMLSLYKDGVALSKHCEELLNAAEAELEKLEAGSEQHE